MPRGKRKRSQLAVRVWTPEGDRLELTTLHDLTPEKWIVFVREAAKRLLAMTDDTEALLKARRKESPRVR